MSADLRLRVAAIVREHVVDMSGTAIGGGWDIWDARCPVCGPIERGIYPPEHVADVLLELADFGNRPADKEN